MALRLARRQQKLPSNPSLIRLFSNSSSDSPPQAVNASDEKPSQSQSDFSYSSPFTDIKATLKQKLQDQQEQGRNPFARPDVQAQNRVSLQDLGMNLAKFQRRSNFPPSQSPPQISLEALFKQTFAKNSADPRNDNGHPSNSINVRENLMKLKKQTNSSNNMERRGVNLQSFNNTLRNLSKENVSSNVFEGSFPKSMVVNEMDDWKGREGEAEGMLTEFLTSYNEEELGEKLKMLRPEGEKEQGWFSLRELNQRLVKLRQLEEKETQSQTRSFAALRNVISSFKNGPYNNEVLSQQSISILGHLGGVPENKQYPPKEELVDTYFHPDNMSSAEKMKVELTKVRDEFKMSESDCGSARVQVAQLTTKIKHLSSTLHKKDKHSRKGLLGMVQKRKKLLKYLRRTDWDSYCLVLSKLSLRDNPDYKF